MRTETHKVTIYTFDELPTDEAKDNARDWWRTTNTEWFWIDESLNSVRVFCDQFGVKITDYELAGPYGHSFIRTNATHDNFRGLRLSEFDREAMPTGYIADCPLWETFYDEFKATGSAWLAFRAAIGAGVRFIDEEMESQERDEFIDDMLIGNEFEFLSDGKRWRGCH